MIRFNCEKCGQRYKTDEYFPEELECKKCGAAVTIPSMHAPEEVKVPILKLPPSLAKNLSA